MHSNGEIIKQTYDAFGRGDMPTVFGILDKEIKWHVPGQSPLSGDYRGHDAGRPATSSRCKSDAMTE